MDIEIKKIGLDALLVQTAGRLDLDGAVEYGTKIKDAIDKQEKNRSKYDFQLYFLKNEKDKDKDKDKEEENDSLYLSGKSFPGVYRSIYNELKSTNPSKTALDLMKVFGIGIDCSCFVSRALATIFENLKQDQPIQLQCLGDSETKGRLRTNMQH